MINQTFTLPRKGLVGNKPVGADYMDEIKKRAKRLQAIERAKPVKDERRLRLPGM